MPIHVHLYTHHKSLSNRIVWTVDVFFIQMRNEQQKFSLIFGFVFKLFQPSSNPLGKKVQQNLKWKSLFEIKNHNILFQKIRSRNKKKTGREEKISKGKTEMQV